MFKYKFTYNYISKMSENKIDNVNNLNNLNIPNNQKNVDKAKLEEDYKNFMGSNVPKPNHSECGFCGKYFIKDMLVELSCPHCWGFCFCGNFDLEKFTFNGPQEFGLVKNYLKKTYNFHPKSCNSMDCIYFKINKFNTDKKLNRELGEFLGIMEPLPVKKDENKVGANVTLNKKRNVKINFKLSSISI